MLYKNHPMHSKLTQTSWLHIKRQQQPDLRFSMFLCSNSSAVGLWLSRLRKKSRISFWTISHSPQFSVLKSYFGGVKGRAESTDTAPLCTWYDWTMRDTDHASLSQLPLFSTHERQNMLCHLGHDSPTPTPGRAAES